MTPPAVRIQRVLILGVLLLFGMSLSLHAQDLQFADGLVYNDFYAVTVHTVEGESFTLFDTASFAGEGSPWPDPEGRFGELPASSPDEGMAYFLWVRRVGTTGAVTYPLAFRKIREIRFTGPYGGTAAAPPEEGVLGIGEDELTVNIRRDAKRFTGWFGRLEPPVPFYTPAVLTLTDESEQDVFVKTDGFLGGIDEEFGTYAMLWLRHDGIERLVFQHEGVFVRCPECGSIFFDDRQGFCPFDGETLVPAR